MHEPQTEPDSYRPPQLGQTTGWEKVEIFFFLAAIFVAVVIVAGKLTQFAVSLPLIGRLMVATLAAGAGYRFGKLWYRVNREYWIKPASFAVLGQILITLGSGFLFYQLCR